MTDSPGVAGCQRLRRPSAPAAHASGLPRAYGISVAGLLLITLAGAAFLEGQGKPPGELDVKGLFVLNMIRFASWESVPGEDAAFLPVCALANSDFADAVRHAVRGKSVQSRAIAFKIDADPEPSRCRVLIFDANQYQGARPALAAVRNAPVLTVGNGTGLVDLGGMFELVIEDRKVRFDTNLNAIHQSDLRLNPKLLELSRNVVGR